MKVNYDAEQTKAKKANLKLLDDAVLTKDKKEKVKRYALKKGLSIKACEKEFRSNKLFRSLFIPDTSRQNVHEKAFGAWLQERFGEDNVFKLSNSGTTALFFEKGSLTQGKKSDKNLSKSIDFDLVFNGKRFLISHKYTENEGGSQDNQYTDIQLFLKEAQAVKESKTYAIAVVDGEYYQRYSRLEFLQKLYQKKKVFVTTSDKLESLIKKIAPSKSKKSA